MLFSALSTNLGNRKNRFPHSHRHDYDEKDVRKSPGRSRLKLPASNPPFRLISGLEKTARTRSQSLSVIRASGNPIRRLISRISWILLAGR